MNPLIHRSAVFGAAMAFILATSTSASAQLNFVPSEGGWVDLKNNLVWGLDYTYFTTTAPNGSTAWGTPEPVNWPTAEAMAANYPALLDQYGWYDAGDVAAYWEAQGLDWRQPTVDEVKKAYKAGFLQRIYWYASIPRWTSTTKTNSNNVLLTYVIYLSDGSVEIDIANPGFPIFVRPYR